MHQFFHLLTTCWGNGMSMQQLYPPLFIITQPESWCSFYHPEGRWYYTHACMCASVYNVHWCVAVDLRSDSPAAVHRGQPQANVKPDCTLTISDSDFIDMATGKLDGNKVRHHCATNNVFTVGEILFLLSSFVCSFFGWEPGEFGINKACMPHVGAGTVSRSVSV